MRLDPNGRKLAIGKKAVPLRNMEYALMEYFMNHAGKVLNRTQLLEDVWDRNIFCSTNTIDVHVSMLRQKLHPHVRRDIIKTIHCIGYMLDL